MKQSANKINKRIPRVVIRVQKGKRADHLYLDIHVDGKRQREFLKLYLTGDKSQDREAKLLAEEVRSARIVELRSKQHGIEPIAYKQNEDFKDFFATNAQTKGKPWRNTLSHLNKYHTEFLRFYDVNAEWIHGFRDYLKRQGLAPNSVITYLEKVKTALNLAVREKIIPQNPFIYTDKIKRKRTQRVHLTVEELSVLVRFPCQHPEVKRAFLFSCFTGLRISDIRSLTWSSVKKDGLHVVQRKTGDYTYIPLATMAAEFLGSRGEMHAKDCVFQLPKTDDLFNRYLKKWCVEAGLDKHVTSHVGRHTFATMLITQGNDLYAVQHLLGHRDIKVTQQYAKLVDARKVQAVNLLPTILDEHEDR